MDTNLTVAHEKLETLLSDEETISQAWERERAILEYNSLMNSAREEGREEGIEQGIEIGREEEHKKRLNEKLDSVKKLMKLSISIEEISEIVGLSIEEIKNNLER